MKKQQKRQFAISRLFFIVSLVSLILLAIGVITVLIMDANALTPALNAFVDVLTLELRNLSAIGRVNAVLVFAYVFGFVANAIIFVILAVNGRKLKALYAVYCFATILVLDFAAVYANIAILGGGAITLASALPAAVGALLAGLVFVFGLLALLATIIELAVSKSAEVIEESVNEAREKPIFAQDKFVEEKIVEKPQQSVVVAEPVVTAEKQLVAAEEVKPVQKSAPAVAPAAASGQSIVVNVIVPNKQKEAKPAVAPTSPFIGKRRHSSFENKVKTADADLRHKYYELRDYIKAYGINNRISIPGDTFSIHRVRYAFITISGKHIKVNFALDPKNYSDSTIPVETNVAKKFEDLPLTFKIKSDLSLRRAEQLVDDAMKKAGIVKPEDSTAAEKK